MQLLSMGITLKVTKTQQKPFSGAHGLRQVRALAQ